MSGGGGGVWLYDHFHVKFCDIYSFDGQITRSHASKGIMSSHLKNSFLISVHKIFSFSGKKSKNIF